jgi:hypothetical protein
MIGYAATATAISDGTHLEGLEQGKETREKETEREFGSKVVSL